MFGRKKNKKPTEKQDSNPEATPVEEEGLPPTMLDRWARDDEIGGAFTVIKKDGTRIKI